MLIDMIGNILKKAEKEGRLKILSKEESNGVMKAISDEMKIVRREYILKQARSEEDAKKIYFNC